MFLYRTVFGVGEAEQVILRSRFITRVKPIESYEEGQKFVASIKQQYKDATHNVPVIVFGSKQEHQWASDDGEPQGTSGPPMLRLIVEEGLTNLALVVTRYFGGTKLGTGGLVRAYSSSARLGIENAGIAEVSQGVLYKYEFDYVYLPKVQSVAKSSGNFIVSNVEYSDKVMVELETSFENSVKIESIINDISSGQNVLIKKNEVLIKQKID